MFAWTSLCHLVPVKPKICLCKQLCVACYLALLLNNHILVTLWVFCRCLPLTKPGRLWDLSDKKFFSSESVHLFEDHQPADDRSHHRPLRRVRELWKEKMPLEKWFLFDSKMYNNWRSKRKPLKTTGFGPFSLLPIGFFGYPFLTHGQLCSILDLLQLGSIMVWCMPWLL